MRSGFSCKILSLVSIYQQNTMLDKLEAYAYDCGIEYSTDIEPDGSITYTYEDPRFDGFMIGYLACLGFDADGNRTKKGV
jgi:hypothetical protein